MLVLATVSNHLAPAWRRRLGQAGGTIFLLTTGAACDPTFQFVGTVKAPTGAAVADARVRFLCDGAVQGREVRTQANGSFDEHRIGWFSDSCVVRIDADGFEPKVLPVGEHCRTRASQRDDASCITVQVDTTLRPANVSAGSQ